MKLKKRLKYFFEKMVYFLKNYLASLKYLYFKYTPIYPIFGSKYWA